MAALVDTIRKGVVKLSFERLVGFSRAFLRLKRRILCGRIVFLLHGLSRRLTELPVVDRLFKLLLFPFFKMFSEGIREI